MKKRKYQRRISLKVLKKYPNINKKLEKNRSHYNQILSKTKALNIDIEDYLKNGFDMLQIEQICFAAQDGYPISMLQNTKYTIPFMASIRMLLDSGFKTYDIDNLILKYGINSDAIINIAFDSLKNKEKIMKNIKKYLTNAYLNKTDFTKDQYPLLKELFENETVINTYGEFIEEILNTPNQECIGIYDKNYYDLYLRELTDFTNFEDIANGEFNEYSGFYKTKDGQYLIDINIY